MKMLTAKDMQNRLQVDRSTIYRMAEAGQIPAVKVGKQWRFPAQQIETWLGNPALSRSKTTPQQEGTELTTLLPLECVQLIQDTFADLLGVTMLITDMEGQPVTSVSNPCGLFNLIRETPEAWQLCVDNWRALAHKIDLEPKYIQSHLGLLCTRAMVRVGTELKGMVMAGFIAPEQWPPTAEQINKMAAELHLDADVLTQHLQAVCYLQSEKREQVQQFIQRIANIVAHIVDERQHLTSRLAAIADLTSL